MGEDVRLVREMGCTEADFLRWLPGATRHAKVESVNEAGVSRHRIRVDEGMVEISTSPSPPRRIGAIVLPVLDVRFRFICLDLEQRAEFLAYFDHYTRRGGG